VIHVLFLTSRLRPNELQATSSAGTALDFAYNFVDGSNNDNGNVMAITNNIHSMRSQSFGYDQLNRISLAFTTATYSTDSVDCWGEVFQYDNTPTTGGAWGNLTNIGVYQPSGNQNAYVGCTQENLSLSVNTSNRITNTGFSYDTAGNEMGDGMNSYVYDAENHLTSAAGVSYTYDGDGKRVQKSNGKLYWYGTGSDPLDESDASGNITDEYVFFGGKRIARRDSSGNVVYYFSDHLGTSRLVTDSTGATLLDDSDFYPFGGERPVLSSSGNTYKFTGKERDTESGLDMFGARYYGSSLGRFMTPDWAAKPVNVPYADFGNPQSLNLYSYVKNNPTTTRDLDGHCEDTLTFPACVGGAIGGPPGAAIGLGVGVLVTVGVAAYVYYHHKSDDTANKNAPPPTNSQSKTQAQSTPADPNQGSSSDKEGAQDKKLSKAEVKNLEENTGQSAHEIKEDALGTDKNLSKFDLYKNSDGDIVVKPKGSSGAGEQTGYTTEHLKTPEPKPESE